MICPHRRNKRQSAFTTFEVVIALAVSALVIGCLVEGFVQSARRAESSAYVLAAQARAVEGLEQVRAARWEPSAFPPVDQVVQSNFPVSVSVLDMPKAGLAITYATNYTTIRMISTNPPLKMVRVDTIWPGMRNKLMTNSIYTFRAPDQ